MREVSLFGRKHRRGLTGLNVVWGPKQHRACAHSLREQEDLSRLHPEPPGPPGPRRGGGGLGGTQRQGFGSPAQEAGRPHRPQRTMQSLRRPPALREQPRGRGGSGDVLPRGLRWHRAWVPLCRGAAGQGAGGSRGCRSGQQAGRALQSSAGGCGSPRGRALSTGNRCKVGSPLTDQIWVPGGDARLRAAPGPRADKNLGWAVGSLPPAPAPARCGSPAAAHAGFPGAWPLGWRLALETPGAVQAPCRPGLGALGRRLSSGLVLRRHTRAGGRPRPIPARIDARLRHSEAVWCCFR